ncbi:protein OCTOPUS-like [Vigna umbellata]|uniref:protein OCTOPUS-like n=1 Tax=Vigna umbellata TaxID=87088 RepID=UPI001F5F19CE|nr:protein OCTOPUS-like [Vigna umbellata]
MNPPQPPQAHRPSTSCPRHPDEAFTGFCPSCLCERLALLDPNNNNSPATARKPPSTAAAALKALFRPPALPELRRTKSFSASKNEPFSTSFEPQRKSCDVRVRSTLSNLFHQDLKPQNDKPPELNDIRPRVLDQPVDKQEAQEEEEDEKDEIRVVEEPKVNVNEIVEVIEELEVEEIDTEKEKEKDKEEELVAIVEEEEELKTMKDHIDLDSSQAKQQKEHDFKDLEGSFFSAASVFSKKLQKWRQKQKAKKRRNGALPVEKPIGRQFRDTQSEIADYGFGRRSCDTDPRFSLDAGRFSLDAGQFSLDAGRMSFDDPRYSLEEPRASWDGYLLGRSNFPRMPTMLSVVEDAPVQHVMRTDTQIPVEEEPVNDDEGVPGGNAQTKEYYSDSSSRRRKSLDRSNSVRKSVSLEVDELTNNGSGGANGNGNLNVNENAKVAPSGVDYVQGVRVGFNEREFGSNSMREDCYSEKMFDVGVIGNGDGNGNGKGGKKGRRWRWSIWGFIHRRGGNKDEDEDRYSRVNGVERSYSETWGGDGRGGGGGGGGGFNGRMLRSNSSVSWRNAQGVGNGGGGFGGFRRNGVQGNGNGKKGKEEFVLERNRSARYSPNNIDNGLLRFYLTPMRGSRRNGSVKSRSNQAHSIARSVLGLY